MNKFQLLDDFIDIKHPITGKLKRLYRIISLKDFGNIKQYTVGGFVESENNLSQTDNSWIFHTAKVFDLAILQDDSFLFEHALAYGNAQITNSVLRDYSKAHGHCQITNSSLTDQSEIVGGTITDSNLRDASKIYGTPTVRKCNLWDGSIIKGSAIVENCTLTNTSQIKGDAKVLNCKLSGNAFLKEGVHKNETFHEELMLSIQKGFS